MLYNAKNLLVNKIALKNSPNEVFNCVYFTKNLTCATDGFRLLEISVDSTAKVEDYPQVQGVGAMRGCKPFLVPARSVAELKIPKNKNLPALECVALKHVDDTRVEFLTTDLENANITQARRIDAAFPDYEKIFPTGNPLAEVNINGAYLAEITKIMADIGKNGIVRMKIYGAEKPVVLTADSGTQQARALLQGVRE